MEPKVLNEELGNSDIYLIDQILKNRFDPASRILDAGCGEGRNMIWFIRNNYNIYGIDTNPEAVKMTRLIARSNNFNFTSENIIESSIEVNPFPDGFFDFVLCMNVLHSAEGEDHFFRMISSLFRILKIKGHLLISLHSELNVSKIRAYSGQQPVFKLTDKVLDKLAKTYRIGSIEPFRTLQIEGKENTTYIWMSKKISIR